MVTCGRSPVKVLSIHDARSFPEGCCLKVRSGMRGILCKSSVVLRLPGMKPRVSQNLWHESFKV